jgi:3' terminal RNA ribose 2'-O-methyltransferase Hen1
VKAAGAKTVLDLGCGEGKLLKLLLEDRQFTRILGMDVSLYALDIAKRRLKLDRLSDRDRDRLTLLQGSATYRDRRMEGFDAVLLVEVMEHLELHRLPALERVVFAHARPGMVVVTTPRADYNEKFAEQKEAGQFRHDDHRFEWTEAEFQTWATRVAAQHGYQVTFQSLGEAHEQFGAPSQMGVFKQP